jgi:elongation factor G
MKDIAVQHVRNMAWLGHTGSGKTSLLDAILFKLGISDRKGQPDNGTSAADWTEEEKDRKITVWAKPFSVRYQPPRGPVHQLIFIDTPGYADFVGQQLSALHVSDAALLFVDAASGIQVGTVRAWKECEKRGIPRGVVITGVDCENADPAGVLASLRAHWGNRCVPATLATRGGGQVLDVFQTEGWPEDLRAEAEGARHQWMDVAAESDDALLEKYLGGEALTGEELAHGLRRAVASTRCVPVFMVSARTDAGIEPLLQRLVDWFPSPLDRPMVDSSGGPVDPSPDRPFVGFVWRTIFDPFVGQLSLCRVVSGTLRAEGEIYNVSKGTKERVSGIILLNGRHQETIPEAHAGDIVAFSKLKTTTLNDVLSTQPTGPALPPIVVPNPVMAYAVAPKTQGDDDKLMSGLQRIAEEDPTLRVERNAETRQLVLWGMGDIQINVAIEKMRRHNKLEVVLSPPKVPYKETVTGRGEGHYKHKKQTGGRGQYGEVYLRIEPRDPNDPEWFVDEVVGGVIPGNFMPAVQKGLLEAMSHGPLAGAPVVNVKVRVYDGSYHEVDSSEISFKIAAARAFKDGMLKSKPVLLEPIMKLRIVVPEQCMGDVTGDLNQRRGRILGMDTEDGMQVITAEVPQAELFQYSSQLRSITGGRGSFEMEFSRLEIVPSHLAQKIIAEAQKQVKEEEEE